MRSRWFSATAVVAAVVSLAACGGSKDRGDTAACKSSEVGRVPAEAPLVSMLVAQGEGQRQSQALDTVVTGATHMEAQVIVSGVGPGKGAPNLVVNTRLVAQGENDLMRESDMKCKEKSIRDAYARLGKGNMPAVDVVSALVDLKNNVHDAAGREVQVVILGSGASRTELSDGRVVDLGDRRYLDRPKETLNILAREGVNFDCSGWKVTMVGAGTQPNGEPLEVAEDSALKEFWSLYFSHCGGTLVSYGPQLVAFPVAGAVQGANTSLVPVEIDERPERVVATIDSSVLFDVGSAELRARAGDSLERLIPLLRQAKGAVRIDGHTDSTGDEAINEPLSRARAASVAEWIRSRAGIPRTPVKVRGFGDRRPVASNATPRGRARNRRVVILIEKG